MRIGVEPVGRLGILLLTLTGLAGAALAVHGWSSRHTGAVPAAALVSPAPPAPTAPASPTASSGPSASAPPSATPSRSTGPLLSSMPYAAQSFLIYPGPQSAAARQALTGLTVTIHRNGASITLTTGVNGGQASAPQTFAASDRVYIVESSLGDDSGATDYNLGDDGLVVTDVSGRIVR